MGAKLGALASFAGLPKVGDTVIETLGTTLRVQPDGLVPGELENPRGLVDILGQRRIIATGQHPCRRLAPPLGDGRRLIAHDGNQRVPVDLQGIVMDHERAIGGHELARSGGRIASQSRIEDEDPVVDRRIDPVAEFDDERRLPRIQKAWSRRHRRWIGTGLLGHPATGLNGFSTIPACSSRPRTRLAVATA